MGKDEESSSEADDAEAPLLQGMQSDENDHIAVSADARQDNAEIL